jgi:hypothetical protein
VGLKFAAGPDDTGVVISYNTEAEGVADTAINGFTDTILGGLSINPITWSTERGKEAGVSREDERVKGSRFSKDKVWRDYPHFTGAYIHPERGTIIAPMDIAGYDYAAAGVPALTQADGFMSSFWAGPSSLHGNDYKLFYYDLQANVDARIEAWYRTHP